MGSRPCSDWDAAGGCKSGSMQKARANSRGAGAVVKWINVTLIVTDSNGNAQRSEVRGRGIQRRSAGAEEGECAVKESGSWEDLGAERDLSEKDCFYCHNASAALGACIG